ncbi:MAG: transporter [Bacteroidales bacterium]
MKKLTTCILLMFTGAIIMTRIVFAQTDPIPGINTDRPTQGLSPFTVEKGFFQLESGAIFVDRKDQTRNWEKWSIATTNLRYGVYDHFEVSINSSYEHWTEKELNDGSISTMEGFGPVSAAFKVRIADEKGIRPQMAIAGSITFRHLGGEDFAPTYSYPVGLFIASHSLGKRWSLGYNFGFAYNGENPDGFFIYTGSLGYLITDNLWSFAEAYGNFDNGDHPNHRLNGGLTYLIANNFQVDVTAGWGLDSEVTRLMLNAGFAWRLPR